MPIESSGASEVLSYLDAQLADRTDDWERCLQRTVEMLDRAFDHYNWTGVYLIEGNVLVLGPYVGPPTDLVRIPIGQGLCGAAVSERRTIIVDDVTADPRYLPCFPATRSEIVAPIFDGERVVGEIDIDSDRPAAFGEPDIELLEGIAQRLGMLAPVGEGQPS